MLPVPLQAVLNLCVDLSKLSPNLKMTTSRIVVLDRRINKCFKSLEDFKGGAGILLQEGSFL